MKKRIFSLALVLALALSFAVPAGASSEEGGLRIIAPEDWELGVGQSRTLDYVFPADVTARMLEWESSNKTVAVVDEWGRVTGVSPGEAVITATQTDVTLSDSVTVTVAATPTQGGFGRRVVDYAGAPVAEVENLQKIVTRYSKDEALASDAVPAEVKSALEGGKCRRVRAERRKMGDNRLRRAAHRPRTGDGEGRGDALHGRPLFL